MVGNKNRLNRALTSSLFEHSLWNILYASFLFLRKDH